MSQIIKNEDGTETELFTAEELEAKALEKVQEASVKSEEEKVAALAEKEAELATAQEELEKLKLKDHNFEITRRGKEKADGKEGDLAKTVELMQKELNDFRRQPIEEAKNAFIATQIGSNKELKDKFDVFWGKLGTEVKTKTEAEAAMTQAFMLASDGRKPDLGTRMNQASVSDDFAGGGEKVESEDSKGFGAKMGLSEADKKNYGPGAKVDLIKPNIKAKA